MQSIFLFSDIAKFADFRCKKADVSRSQGVYHVINIFSESFLDKVLLCQVSSLYNMCNRF